MGKNPRMSKVVDSPKNMRCPRGIEALQGAHIPIAYIGGGPYIVRGKQVRGSFPFAIDLLSRKMGFKYTLMPEKGIKRVIANVSALPSYCRHMT